MTDKSWQWCEVFNTDNVIEAHLVKGLLEQAKIGVLLKGEALQGALGEIPLDQAKVSVWVYQIKLRQAQQILLNYQQQEKDTEWRCPECSEFNGPAFQSCWQCGKDYE